mmetsp:Transcript_8198/g.8991  ORF Transcript_8198/g.8991 Transcript_8198/m.8991 type:complete len:477 (+) Transcript_8198:57-1487(+)
MLKRIGKNRQNRKSLKKERKEGSTKTFYSKEEDSVSTIVEHDVVKQVIVVEQPPPVLEKEVPRVKEKKEKVTKRKKLKKKLSGAIVEPHNWGFPGYLTKEEEEIFQQFTTEVNERGKEFRDTIFSFGYNEEEEHAFCRWLRARKFVLKDAIAMVEQATELRIEPKRVKFYENAISALGVEEAVFKTQYPQVFAGHAKNSCPLFVSKPGKIDMTGLNCITSIENMHKYQWHSMIYGAGAEYRARQSADPNFERFQSAAILDLDGLGVSTITGSVMDMIKHQSHVDSLCFPETMNKLVIINAPTFFSATWQVIRHMLDARTANKIEIYSFRSKWEKRLKELVDDDQLPSDYGGSGPSLAESILKKCNDSTVSRRVTKVMSFKSNDSTSIKLEEGETMDLFVYTKSSAGVDFSVVNAENKSEILAKKNIVANKSNDETSINKVASGLMGPNKFKVYGNVANGRLFSSTQNFLVVANINN